MRVFTVRGPGPCDRQSDRAGGTDQTFNGLPELGWLRQRVWEALLAKAEASRPAGAAGAQSGLREVRRVGQSGAGPGLVRQEEIALPANDRDPASGGAGEVATPGVQQRARHSAQSLLFYAGAYAFGRTATRTTIVDGVPHKSRCHRLPRAEWTAMVRDHHEAHIALEVYERTQALIAHNAQMRGHAVRGAAREGSSLVAGLLRRGHCGRRRHVCTRHSSSSRPHSIMPSAVCGTVRALILVPAHPPPRPHASDPPSRRRGSSALAVLLLLAARPRSGNGGLALYRSSGGPLSLEPLAPFSCRPGQSFSEPPGARRATVLWSASSWPSRVTSHHLHPDLPCSGEGYSLLSYSGRTEYKARHVGDGRGDIRCMHLVTVSSATS
jgi:hypothetical protein